MIPELSVVIVNYNTRDLLSRCLQSLTDLSDVDLEVIVVDNASSDGSAERVQEQFPNVHLIALPENKWYCAGNNEGIAAATADYVLLLNPDTEVLPDTLSNMLSYLRDNPSYAGVTCQLVYPDGKVQRTCSRIPGLSFLFANHTILGMIFPRWKQQQADIIQYGEWERDTDRDVDVIPGSCTLMLRPDVWLDEDLLLYFPEDTLAQEQKKKFRFLGNSRIIHHEKAVTKTWRATSIYYRDLMVYVRKHHGIIVMIGLWLLSRPLFWGMWIKHNFRKSTNN